MSNAQHNEQHDPKRNHGHPITGDEPKAKGKKGAKVVETTTQLSDEQKAALAAEKQAEKDRKAAEKKAAAEQKAAEKEAKAKEAQEKHEAKAKEAEAERAAKAEQKAKEAEAKRAEPAEKREAEKAEKAKAREAAKEQAAKERAEAQEKAKADRAAALDEQKRQRDAEREANAAKRKEEAEAAKAKRKEEAAARAAQIAERKASNKPESGRRTKATHIVYTGEGLSSPQALSIRGKVLQYIKDNCPVGEEVSIDALGEAVKPLLYGSSVRSYLSKLEEMGHVNFVTKLPEGAVDGTEPQPEGEQQTDEQAAAAE